MAAPSGIITAPSLALPRFAGEGISAAGGAADHAPLADARGSDQACVWDPNRDRKGADKRHRTYGQHY